MEKTICYDTKSLFLSRRICPFFLSVSRAPLTEVSSRGCSLLLALPPTPAQLVSSCIMSASDYAAAFAADSANYNKFFPAASSPLPPPPPPPPTAAAPVQADPTHHQQYANYYAQQATPQAQPQYAQQAYSNGYYGYQSGAYAPAQQQSAPPHQSSYATAAATNYAYAAPAQPYATASAYSHYPQQQQQYPAAQSQPAYYGSASYPPPPPPPPPAAAPHSAYTATGSEYNYAASSYAPTASAGTQKFVLPLASSFVAASSNEFAVAPAAADAAGATHATTAHASTSRGAVHNDTAAAASGVASSSPGALTPGGIVTGGVQFSMQKKSRWSAKTAAPAIAPVGPPNANTANTIYTTATATAAPSLPMPPPPPQTAHYASATTAPHQTSFTPSASMLDYIQRSLAACPAGTRDAVERFLAVKLERIASNAHHAATIDWTREPLAHVQMVQQAQAQVQLKLPPQYGYSYASAAASKSSFPSSAAGTGTNNTPLGVRSSHPTETKDAADDDDADFIPFSNKSKKRTWDDTNASSPKNAKGKKKRNASAAATVNPGLSAADRAEVASRASRFAAYNAEVARSSDTFAHPIQRHLFTAERGGGGSGEGDVDLDWSALHIRGTSTTLEKRYLRLTQAPDPAVVRPEHVLRQALERLMRLWRATPDDPALSVADRAHVHDYKYTCEQIKAIRQDLTVQHLARERLTFDVYEQHARLALDVGDFSEYNQCQTQLKAMYAENRAGDPALRANEPEFLAYRVLYNLVTDNRAGIADMMREVQNQRAEESRREGRTPEPVIATEKITDTSDETVGDTAPEAATTTATTASPVSLAFQVAVAALRADYFTFFRLYPRLPFQCPRLLRAFAATARFKSLTSLVRAFRPGKVELGFFARALAMNDREADAYLRSAGVTILTDGIVDTKATELVEPQADETAATAAEHGVTHALL